MFDGDGAVKTNLPQGTECLTQVRSSRACGYTLGAALGNVLKVAGNNATLQNADTVCCVESRVSPVSHVSAGTDAGVAAFGQFNDVVGIPYLVVGIVGALGVVVIANLDIELFHELFDCVDCVGRFGVDDSDAKFLCELEYLTSFGLVLIQFDNADCNGADVVLLKDGFDGRETLGGDARPSLLVGQRGGDGLAGEKFGGFQACRSRFLAGLLEGELSEGVGLGSESETVGTDFSGNRRRGDSGSQRKDKEGGDDGEPFHSKWDRKAGWKGSQATA